MSQSKESSHQVVQAIAPPSTQRWRAFTSRMSTYLRRRSGRSIKNQGKLPRFVSSTVLGATSLTSTSARPSFSTSITLTAEADGYSPRLLSLGPSEATLAMVPHSNDTDNVHARSLSLPDPRSLETMSAGYLSGLHGDSCPDLTDEVRLLSLTPIYSGPYSHVYKGMCNKQEVAIKVVRPLHKNDSLYAIRRRMRREVETARFLEDSNLLTILGVIDADWCPHGGIITPWCHNGDAARYIRLGHIGTIERYELLCGVASGLHCLHSHSVVHGDLKPGNILIDEDGNPLIGDFGLAKIIEAESRRQGDDLNTTTAHEGTPRYLAYELVMPDPPAPRSTASDIHALGCIGYEFLYLLPPYSERSSNVVCAIAAGGPPATRPSSCLTAASSAIWDLFEQCWDKNPSARPGIFDVCASLESLAGCQLEPLPPAWFPSLSVSP